MSKNFIILITVFLLGCAHSYDSRLNGTWQSNQEETVAEAFRRAPGWKKAPYERVKKFKEMFGHMVITYSNDKVVMNCQEDTCTFNYRIIERGKNFVVIRSVGGLDDDQDLRIEFTEGLSGYWIDAGWDFPEKFDKVKITEQRH